MDVRINGTKKTLFHNGRYEDKCGFIVLKKVPASVDESVVVKIGFEQSQRQFPLRYLVPEKTTERPQFVIGSMVKPIVKEFGQRVVIIGPDLTGTSNVVGSFGVILGPPCVLPPGEALVMVRSSGNADGYFYFHENSLCRSHEEKEFFY